MKLTVLYVLSESGGWGRETVNAKCDESVRKRESECGKSESIVNEGDWGCEG